MPTAMCRRISTSSPTTSFSTPCATPRSRSTRPRNLSDADHARYQDAPLALAIDPLDGSSNIETNVSIGTIFSILPALGAPDADPAASFLQPGRTSTRGRLLHLRAAAGAGPVRSAAARMSSSSRRAWAHSCRPMRAASSRRARQEFAINAANYRHWDEAVRLYVDDCLKGREGPRETRLQHALDRLAGCRHLPHPDARRRVPVSRPTTRKGYGQGRLRLVYEANPIAYADRAGGRQRHRHGEPHPRHRAAQTCTSACRWCSGRRGKSRASPATTPIPA